MDSVTVPTLTVALTLASLFLAYRIARIVLAPVARQWRERPVVMYDEYEGRWRAADRLGR